MYSDVVTEKFHFALPSVNEDAARKTANGYLSREVGIPFSAVDGVFIPLQQPIWQFAIRFRLPKLGFLGIMGIIDVDAETGDPISLSDKQIQTIQDRADAIVQLRTQAATSRI